ncbi:DUF2938 family protein [Pseudomonas sp. 15A4]|uniref:DUF2938 family protein n=1 Tax=Pseudomonas sp. 15A4 TaxID=2804761 RepID=UPI001F07EE48|nr:DUF2938 family protein [Pseudomonas sp. 15A4]
MFEFIYLAILIGIGGTALLDLWALLLKALLGLPTPPWHLVGRWFAGMPKGQFVHLKGIGNSLPYPMSWRLAGSCITPSACCSPPRCCSSGVCNGRTRRPFCRH